MVVGPGVDAVELAAFAGESLGELFSHDRALGERPVLQVAVQAEGASAGGLAGGEAGGGTLKGPLPDGTFHPVAWPSIAPGKVVSVLARWPDIPLKVTPAVKSVKGVLALPKPPNMGRPLLSTRFAKLNNWSRRPVNCCATVALSVALRGPLPALSASSR